MEDCFASFFLNCCKIEKGGKGEGGKKEGRKGAHFLRAGRLHNLTENKLFLKKELLPA